ncbi:MAG: phosphoribosylanthranilate isomerase [Tatlockia sp.]|nr:phosphoribosylanthranilate isomerase [Tatlockia sp.]
MANRVRIKFCGMTREEDIAYATALGVDAIGLIFAPESSRSISLSQAKKLLQNRPPFVDLVAVLVNPNPALVEDIINELGITLLQFHGDESAEFCNQFAKPYIKALHVHSTARFYEDSAKYQQASALLLDTPSAKSRGGTGKTFDWELIPNNFDKPLILAGGLDATNVNSAVELCSPYAVDVCSGVEVSPGIKDHEKMKAFVSTLWGKI